MNEAGGNVFLLLEQALIAVLTMKELAMTAKL
jgi:hypothetical protein